MGHNFINVGEEYDGGSVYRGVNFAANLNVGWRHWLTDPDLPVVAQDSAILVQDYAWYDLARGTYSIPFTSSGNYARWFLRFTVSGCEVEGAIQVRLDGRVLDWRSSRNLDRTFFNYFTEETFASGGHLLEFEQMIPPPTGNPIRQLCSVTLHEYKRESDGFRFDNEYVGAYRSWRQGGALAGYRPTNEKCLMRNMSSEDFCPVCREGMWMQFFNRMSLIDSVEVSEEGGVVKVVLAPVQLAHFRPPEDQFGEEYTLTWLRDGIVQPELSDEYGWESVADQVRGNWQARLRLTSPHIRADPTGLTTFTRDFVI
jgi:hypothetical protein